MKKLVVAALFAAGVAALTTAAFGSSKSPSRAASAASVSSGAVKCGSTRYIGFMAPITGPAASLGQTQVDWAKYYVRLYNKGHKKSKIKLVPEDTELGGPNGTAAAVQGAQALGSNAKVLGVVGPAGSNEVKATTGALKGAGLGFVSGSATNAAIATDGTRTGYFFRTVPTDDDQSKSASAYIVNKLKLKRVYIIDDQEAYSIGLADSVESQLKAKGLTVGRDGVSQQLSDFTSVINKIPQNTQLVYIPWQLPPKGQAFGQQMKGLGRGSVKLMGGDGLFDPAFSGVGSNVYDTFFPVNTKDKRIAGFKKLHKGQTEFFGAPTFEAVHVVSAAIDRACKDGKATRAEVRAQIKKTNIPVKTSLIGLPINFAKTGNLKKHPFGVYHSSKGVFVRVG
ncbi:MAG TPA: branched-chain amino acid ABC transporter substrate-binding protein [Gaiellaceae bacterium]|nr:branched-chain amino acid ABC transporter substrate-binding protein [Gaiellaceae bacterium]